VVLVTGTATLSTGVAYQTNASYNSTTGTGSFRLNRQADGAATVAPVATTGVLNRLLDEGTPNPGAGQFTGTVLEVIVYVPQLSAADITTVETYLNQKYGI
jgi:hypothetical protein